MSMPKQKPGRSKQDYGTPDDFLDAVLRRLDVSRFNYDLACHKDNKIRQALRGMIYPRVDSLEVPWPTTGWNWLNPPFANIHRWVRKAYECSPATQTAILIPAGVSTNWWAEWVHDKAKVLFVRPRLTFKGTPLNPKTGRPDPYPKDLALLLYANYPTPGYEPWNWKG